MTEPQGDLLLDTHVLLWAGLDPERLDEDVREILVDPARRVWVSAVVVAEIAVKASIGKLQIAGPVADLAADHGFELMGLEPDQAQRVSRLPPRHRDPFDRLLIAQAITADLTLVTADRQILGYQDVKLLRAA